MRRAGAIPAMHRGAVWAPCAGVAFAVMALALLPVTRTPAGFVLAIAVMLALVSWAPRALAAAAGIAAALALLWLPGVSGLMLGTRACPPETFCEGPGPGIALVPVLLLGAPAALLIALVRAYLRLDPKARA